MKSTLKKINEKDDDFPYLEYSVPHSPQGKFMHQYEKSNYYFLTNSSTFLTIKFL